MYGARVTGPIREQIHPKKRIACHGLERQPTIFMLTSQWSLLIAILLRHDWFDEREVCLAPCAVILEYCEEAHGPVECSCRAVEGRLRNAKPVVVLPIMLSRLIVYQLRNPYFVRSWI